MYTYVSFITAHVWACMNVHINTFGLAPELLMLVEILLVGTPYKLDSL